MTDRTISHDELRPSVLHTEEITDIFLDRNPPDEEQDRTRKLEK